VIVDTHTHLDHPKFAADLEEVLHRAQRAGVDCYIIPGADPKDLSRAMELATTYPSIFFGVGVHPYEIEQFDEALFEVVDHPKCVAVGECGLDYYRLPSDQGERAAIKEAQREIFIRQIEIAKRAGKPLIVHIREASRDAKELLERYGGPQGGVLHCYNASPILLDLAQRNFYFGIGGVVTFHNAKKLVEILPQIPLDRMFLETDAPYLTPHPHRGKRNEPAYLVYVLERIAQILGRSTEELAQITTQNATRLFGRLCYN